MRKEIVILIASAMTFIAIAKVGAIDPNRPGHEHEHDYEHEKRQKYTCSMHPEVVMDHPGNCPKCGMKLVPLKQEKHATSHEDHVARKANEMAMPEHEHGEHKHDQEHKMEMHSSINLADPMNREGSGTSWLPDSSPMYGKMFMFDGDMLMLHGAIFPRYTNFISNWRIVA